jgi:hypothetical protein
MAPTMIALARGLGVPDRFLSLFLHLFLRPHFIYFAAYVMIFISPPDLFLRLIVRQLGYRLVASLYRSALSSLNL